MSETETAEKLEQTINIQDAGPAAKEIAITVPASRIQEKIEGLYGNLQDEAVLPGFRRGRAPRRLVEKRFGESIQDDAKSQLISESYTQVVDENEFDVIGEPEVPGIADLKLPESGDLEFTVKIEITPDVALPDFAELTITKPAADVTDEAMTEEIDKLRERFGSMEATEEAVVEEDYVLCNVDVRAGKDAGDDAEVVATFNDTYALVHGEKHDFKGHVAGILVEDLGKQLVGKKADDVVTISMTGPSAHENEKIKDQDITLAITLKRVERVAPAAIETLFPQMGVQDEEELNLRVKTMLEERAEREQKADMYKQASEQLLEKVELELPEKLTSRQAERVLYRQAMELSYRGVQGPELEQQIAEARSAGEEQAAEQLKQFFILDKASKDLEIEVTEQELNGRISMLAMQQNRRPEKLRQEMIQKGQIEQLYLSIREQKTLEAVIEKATVKDA